MKQNIIRLIPAILTLCLTLTACGGGNGNTASGYDPASTAQALLDSGAFSETLSQLDQDTAATLYGLDPESITDCAVYGSLSAGAEELAVIALKDEDTAAAALAGLEQRIDDQKAALENYQPEEVTKLDNAILEQNGNTVLMVVAADNQAALDVLDGMGE